MAFEKINDLLGENPEEEKSNTAEQEKAHHVGSGEPMDEARTKDRQIAREIEENDQELRAARQEGNLARVRELMQRSEELITERNQLLRETARNRQSKLAG